MAGAVFASALNMSRVLTEQAPRVLEVPCTGAPTQSAQGLQHLTGCVFKREYSENGLTYRLKVGDFDWAPVACGAVAQQMKKGEMASGSLVSFLGNSSGGILKPWISDNARVCSFADGVSPAPLMVQKAKNDHAIGTLVALLVLFCFLTWVSTCVFFPDQGNGDSVFNRSMVIGFLAVLASCFGSGMHYFFGTVGWFIAIVIITLLAFGVGSPEWYQRREADPEDPTEEEPLLPATQPQPTEAPVADVERNAPEPVAEEEYRPKGDMGGAELAAAVALGLAGGLLGGILLSVLLSEILK